jgi:uncharacterized membrane protein YphA (DoxX/SURF4 family)
MHFIVPDGLPDTLDWVYELSDPLHAIAGTVEILGGLGLILPGLTRMLPGLTSLAAAGLVVVMVGAAVWHGTRGEVVQVALNLVNAGPLGYLAYGRWRLSPLQAARSTPVA